MKGTRKLPLIFVFATLLFGTLLPQAQADDNGHASRVVLDESFLCSIGNGEGSGKIWELQGTPCSGGSCQTSSGEVLYCPTPSGLLCLPGRTCACVCGPDGAGNSCEP